MSSTNVNIIIRFGQRLRQLRLARGLSQEDLAALCQLDRTYISSLERGHRNISLKNIATIASALDLTIAQLVEGIDDDL